MEDDRGQLRAERPGLNARRAGWRSALRAPIFGGTMRLSFLRFASPMRAYRDLRAFLAARQRHELWFMIASLTITFIIVVMFFLDSNMAPPYRAPDIIYVQQWPANRTDAEIIAQQKIDGPKEKADKDAQAQAEAASREQFRKLNNQLDAWGL
jgi:hypothetical protein